MRRRPSSALFGALLIAVALVPYATRSLERVRAARRLTELAHRLPSRVPTHELDAALSMRAARLSPLLASWETVGGCGAGTSGGSGTVKWIGHNTSGGLFQNITQVNYTHLLNGENLVLTTQFTQDIGDQWNIGVLLPFVYKRYNDYMQVRLMPVDVVNSGIGDIALLGTFRFGPIHATSLSATVGLPTGTHAAVYKNDLLTQDKQLGLGRATASLTLDQTFDQQWGLIVLGALASYRGGENELGNYRAPMASGYAYTGYFLGPFVPALGVALTGFLSPDRDRTLAQDVPLVLLAANASLEWSTDWIAVLVGVSVPFGLYAQPIPAGGARIGQSAVGVQPWTAALGVSISPF